MTSGRIASLIIAGMAPRAVSARKCSSGSSPSATTMPTGSPGRTPLAQYHFAYRSRSVDQVDQAVPAQHDLAAVVGVVAVDERHLAVRVHRERVVEEVAGAEVRLGHELLPDGQRCDRTGVGHDDLLQGFVGR